MAPTDLTPYMIEFDNANTAIYVKVSPVTPADDIVQALAIRKPLAVMTIVGGAKGLDETALVKLTDLFSRGVGRAARDRSCLVVTGGTDWGVMRMMGQGIADRGRTAPCVGIAPYGLVNIPGGPTATETSHYTPLEPNHSHFVFVDGDKWGVETETQYRLVRNLADGVPSISIVVNGGENSRKEVLYCVRQNRPVILIEGSGRLADELAALWKARQAMGQGQATEEEQAMLAAMIETPGLSEIIEEGELTLFPISGQPAELEALIQRLLPVALVDDKSLLKNGWQQFANFDAAASQKSRGFRGMRRLILWVGVLAVTFAVVSSAVNESVLAAFYANWLPGSNSDFWVRFLDGLLHLIALTVPIVSSVLLAGANRFYPGEDWVALRGGAEDLKKEIFRYRAQISPYNEQDRTEKLAQMVQEIGNRVMRDNVKKQDFEPYQGQLPPPQALAQGDDGFSSLTGDAYLNYRLLDQLAFYENRVIRLYRNIRLWQWTIYASGGVGTLLGLLGFDAFIAIATSVGTGLASYLEMIQAEATLRGYNETAQILRGIQAEWLSRTSRPLSLTQRRQAFEELVTDTEHALITERSGWISEMNQFRLQQKQEQGSPIDGAPPKV